MARVTVEDCLPLIPNRFALVLLATKRTRQLMAGARPIIETSKNKPCVLSLREIATSKVRFDRDVRTALEGKYDTAKQIAQQTAASASAVSQRGNRNVS